MSEQENISVEIELDVGVTSSEVEERQSTPHDCVQSETKSGATLTLNEAPLREPEFEMLNPVEFDEITGGSGAKSGPSSIGSFAEVPSLPDSPGIEMTMEHSDMKRLLHDAGKESGESSTETDEHSPPLERNKNRQINEHAVEEGKQSTVLVNQEISSHENKLILTDNQTIPEIINDTENLSPSPEDVDGKHGTSSDFSKIHDEGASLFSSITYLGSSTVNAPVSDVELKRMMAILKDQSRVAVEVVLSVSPTYDGNVKLIDPQNKTVIACYQLQKILFCGRGNADGGEQDCFAFNTCHGTADIFHCHVFRCLQEDAAAKVLSKFAQSFRNQIQSTDPVDSGLVYKFDFVLDILEDDGKGAYTSMPRDKTCFKLRQDVHKQIVISLHQLSNRLLIIERCFGLLICPGRNVTHADMNLLEKVTMENLDNGRTYIISGNWDPEREDTLVLNTETKKDFVVHMTVAVDCVVSGISEPIRFIKEVGVKVFPSNERFWNPSRPKIKEQYILELRLVGIGTKNHNS